MLLYDWREGKNPEIVRRNHLQAHGSIGKPELQDNDYADEAQEDEMVGKGRK